MKERGIIFNAEMVRAILDGRKTQTRRIIKSVPATHNFHGWVMSSTQAKDEGKACWAIGDSPLLKEPIRLNCPLGKIGDRLWVRETWRKFDFSDECGCSEYPCGCPENGAIMYRATQDDGESKWRPSTHMPRRYSRITLEITNVRVERLQDISEQDAIAEGITNISVLSKYIFSKLWESIYGFDSWSSNPWVWVIEFKKVE